MIHWPELLPEEMLAGYVGRVGRMNGISQKRLWHHLHEHETLTSKPGHLRTWVHALATAYPLDADTLASSHTLIPLLMVLRPTGSSIKITNSKALHLCETALPDGAPRLCRACVKEDLGFWGLSYWRRNHQIRGIDCCPKHGMPLLRFENPDGLATFPEECQGNACQLTPEVVEPWRSRFTEMVTELIALKNAIPSNQAIYRLLNKCEQFQARHHHNCKRAPLTQYVHRILHGSGLERVFPTLLQSRWETSHSPHTTHWTRSGTGYAYALALTALYAAPDEALRDALTPLSPEETDDLIQLLPESLKLDILRIN